MATNGPVVVHGNPNKAADSDFVVLDNGRTALDQLSDHFKKKIRGHPHLTTTKGALAWADVDVHIASGRIEERHIGKEDDNEAAAAIEYWDAGELIHRSAHVHLKRPYVESQGEIANFR